mmetsp:Transcript_19755/g.41284  ORF Transcript_19755/g.41284 Transcript_19755/m.41284 type:complete len:219 (-) Transcript_19755:34-690(-)
MCLKAVRYSLELVTWKSKAKISRNPSNCREHANASVLQLSFPDPVHGQCIRDTQRVETLLPTDPALEYLRVAKEWHCRRHFHLLGVGLGLHIWALTELLHGAELGTANAAWQGTNAAVLDGRTIEGLAVVNVLHEELDWLTPPSIFGHIGQGRLSKHAVLHHEAHDGDHRQTAVVALRSLLSLQLLRVNAIQQLGAQTEIVCAQSTFSGLHQDFMSAH